jgi:hypothetical protein
MKRPSLHQDEQQELWNTLEVLMHGRAASEVRCAQQRLERMQSHLRPRLAPATQGILANIVRAAVCASHGGEQRFYWLTEVENRWRALTAALEAQESDRSSYQTNRPKAALAHS